MTPDHELPNQEPTEPSMHDEELSEESPKKERLSWFAKLGWLAWIILCFELGAFLLVYPWMDTWQQNGIQDWLRLGEDTWLNPYFRGALSGLGVLNIYVSLVELFYYLKSLLFE